MPALPDDGRPAGGDPERDTERAGVIHGRSGRIRSPSQSADGVCGGIARRHCERQRVHQGRHSVQSRVFRVQKTERQPDRAGD